MKKNNCGSCGHPESVHEYEPGFYDVRGKRGRCTYVGCPCNSYK